jgi:DNA gyrase subunit A
MIRIAVANLRVMGRATQGVRLINLKASDSIAAVAKVDVEEEVAELYDEDGNLIVVEDSEAIIEGEVASAESSETTDDAEENENGKDVDNSKEEN